MSKAAQQRAKRWRSTVWGISRTKRTYVRVPWTDGDSVVVCGPWQEVCSTSEMDSARQGWSVVTIRDRRTARQLAETILATLDQTK